MVYWSKALYVFLYCAIFLAKKAESLPECKEGEFHYEYTECGADGGRWHVPVPHHESKCAVTMRPPLYQKSCDGTCPAGQFTDVSLLSEECKPCPKGKHSLGSAVRYTNWTEFPPDFDTYATLDIGESWRNEGESQCNASWVADGNLLRTEVSPCLLRLTYIANIVKDEGSITFWYYYTNDYNDMFFSVSVRNEQCEITKQRRDGKKDNGEEKDEEMSDEDMSDDVYYNTDDDDVISLDPSSQYVWKNATLKLKRGKNLVVWQVERWSNEGNSFSKMVFIREIEVKGTPSTSECVNCPPGTFADKVGSGKCEQCEANFFSEAGAKECEPCNEKTEYSPRGSAKCLERPACEKKDYMEISSECDEENKFQTLYKWIEPKICSEFLDGAVKLPEAGPKVECPTCSPGMYLKDNKCLFCSVGYFSDGVKGCAKCLPTTASDLKHDYRTWRNWPPATDHWCSSYVDGCSTPAGWQLRGHYIDSGFGHSDDVNLDLEVETAGFAGNRGLVSRIATEVGSVTIDFEMDCEGSCEFTMFERKFNRNSATVAHWNGRNTRQNFTYAVTEKGPLTFRWGFKKEGKRVFDPDLKTYKYINDRVKIYSVLLSNTVDGGAEVCSKCRIEVKDSSCVECPTGQYFDAQSSMCKPCKSGTFLNNNKCEKCGPGLVSNPSSSKCYSSCHYHGKDGRHINFLQLKGIHVARTNKFFFGEGNSFFYEYRINLCGVDAPEATCHDNSTIEDGKTQVYKLNASICQMRIVSGSGKSPISTTPAGIGHQLMGVYDEKPQNLSLDVFDDRKLLNESLIYFDFLSHSTTRSCPKGRSVLIILRCDEQASDKGVIKFPSKCQEGTCDGCQFLFLWHSKSACRLCTSDDYEKVVGGCENRKKKIQYIWRESPKSCVGGVKLPQGKVISCSDMTVHEAVKQFQFVIGAVAFILTAIIAILIFLWYKNRVLKYKLYQRVAVTDSIRNDGELPAAESCMADDDEDFGEKVEFKKGGNPGRKLIEKLKDMRADKEDDTMRLTDSFDVDLS